MTGPVLSITDALAFENQPKAPDGSPIEKFGSRMAPLSSAIGLTDIGAIYMEVQPGKRAFPYHLHHGNEELFVILEGEGTYRFEGRDHPVSAGSVCAAPKGPGTAHQLINTGAGPLRYLSISTRNDPDIVEYPDSNKFMAVALGGKSFPNTDLREIHPLGQSLSYFEGEGDK